MNEPCTRIAMWSGPRNISTAMMRAFENRPDTVVIDEPFYGCYLAETHIDHPGRNEVLAACRTDWSQARDALLAPLPPGRTVHYQKHMAHHALPAMDRGWMDRVTNCFLIRSPADVIVSFAKVLPNPTLEDLGFPQQWELFEHVRRRTGRMPPVLDARDVLDDPQAALTTLCKAVGIPFDQHMLRWPAGPRPTDGPWAPHWYAAVEASTGFAPPRPPATSVPSHLTDVYAAAITVYERLARHRIMR